MPAGVPRVSVTFELDANGLLNVRAIETTTKRQNKVKIKNSVRCLILCCGCAPVFIICLFQGRLSVEKVARMVAEAEAYKVFWLPFLRSMHMKKFLLNTCCRKLTSRLSKSVAQSKFLWNHAPTSVFVLFQFSTKEFQQMNFGFSRSVTAFTIQSFASVKVTLTRSQKCLLGWMDG